MAQKSLSPRRLYMLVTSREITLEQFLALVVVDREAAVKYFDPGTIASLEK